MQNQANGGLVQIYTPSLVHQVQVDDGPVITVVVEPENYDDSYANRRDFEGK